MVSIIIPIYNVEKFIQRCVYSLLEQTLEDIEYIFVNDASTDKSLEILNSIVDKHTNKNIKIISHPFNKGLAAARNTGIESAHGDYIMHCDSDDWIEKDMCEQMYNYATTHHADIVVSDFYIEANQVSSISKQCVPDSKEEALRSLLKGSLHGSNCNKIINANLYRTHKLSYINNINMWEDLIMMIKLFYYADSILYLPKPFYHYVQYNENSYTKKITQKSLDNMISGVSIIENFFKQKQCFTLYASDLSFIKLTVKLNLLINSNNIQQKELNKLYPESNKYILSYNAMSYFWRIALWFASHKLLFLFNLMKFIHKLI